MRLQRAAEEALRYGIDLAHQTDNWAANGGAIVALDPDDGAVLAMASSPTYKPSVYVGRIDPKKLEPLLDEEAARRANYPGLNRATAGLYPPGSTWKPVTALAGMQEHVFSAYDSLQCTPVAYYGLDRQPFRNWNPYRQPADDAPGSARRVLRHLLLRDRRPLLPARRRRAGSACSSGRAGSASARRRGSTSGARRKACSRLPNWRWKTFESDWDRAWNPGDSIQLAIGQKDLLVTPLQMAAFYAMLANGGDVVTPYLVSDVEQPRAKGSPQVVLRRFAPRPPQSSGIDPAALDAVRDGLFRATHSTAGTSSGVFASYPISISGKTGTAEKVVPLPGYPSDHLEDQSWWCGWGPTDDAKIVVCALIENGGHGSTAAAPAALRVFERYFGVKSPSTDPPGDRLMIEAAERPRIRVAGRRSESHPLAFVRRLDWILLGTAVALVAYGLWVVSGITRFDVPGDENYFVVRQAIAAGIGLVGLVVATIVPIDLVRRNWRLLYGATLALMFLVFLVAETIRGSKRWIDLGFIQFQPSELGKVLFVLAIAGFLVEKGGRVNRWRTVLSRDRARGRSHPARVPPAGPRDRARLQRRLLRAPLLRRRSLAAAPRPARPRGIRDPLDPLAPAGGGVQVLKPYQAARLTLDPEGDPSGLTYNLNQSITAVGSGGLTGRGPTEASQTRLDYLPEHATDFAFASLAEQRGFVGSAILLLLYLLVVWRGLRVITVASDLYGAVVAGGLVFALVFQVFVNVGMTMGVAPVTGIPLPFVTVGGSSMVANLLMIGILQSIHARGALGGKAAPVKAGRPGGGGARGPQGLRNGAGQGSRGSGRPTRRERDARGAARPRARHRSSPRRRRGAGASEPGGSRSRHPRRRR